MNASSYNDLREQLVMDQLIEFTPGKDGKPGFFSSPLPLKPFEINKVKCNWATANAQNRDMVRRLQRDPAALQQVKIEMQKLQTLGFIKRLKDLPKEIQENLNKGFKHFIPTTIAWKESSCSTKTRICWDSFNPVKRIR